MKKVLLASALALFGIASAQEYKAGAGDVTVDFGLAGGLGDTSINIPNQGFGTGAMFKARYFATESLAYRGLLSLATSSDKEKLGNDTETTKSSSNFALGFGVEKHFTGTDRLSTYVGGDAIIGFGGNKSKGTAPGASTETKGPSTFTFGVRGVFGADYYFAKRVYLGVEAGLGLFYGSNGETTQITSVGSSTTTNTISYGGSSFNISPAVIGGIRLGYAF